MCLHERKLACFFWSALQHITAILTMEAPYITLMRKLLLSDVMGLSKYLLQEFLGFVVIYYTIGRMIQSDTS